MTSRFEGRWYNQHGSVLDLRVSPSGEVKGTFRTETGMASASEEFPVVGFATAELITFSVHFGRHDCVTSWVGHGLGEGEQAWIETVWQMAVRDPGATAGKDLWRGNWCGADTFRRTAPAAAAVGTRWVPSHPIRR